MANEAICIEQPTEFARYDVADGVAIPYGTLVKLTDDHTAAATSADSDTFAGIVWVAISATNTPDQVVVAKNGTWDLTDAGAGITVGGIVSIGGANTIKQAIAAELLTGDLVGKAEETAGAAEVIRVRVGRLV